MTELRVIGIWSDIISGAWVCGQGPRVLACLWSCGCKGETEDEQRANPRPSHDEAVPGGPALAGVMGNSRRVGAARGGGSTRCPESDQGRVRVWEEGRQMEEPPSGGGPGIHAARGTCRGGGERVSSKKIDVGGSLGNPSLT